MNAEQLRVLIDGTKGERMHALYVLAATAGLRLGELLALTWDDIELGDDDGAQPQMGRAGLVQMRGQAPLVVRVTKTLHRSQPGDADHDPADPWVFRPPKTDRGARTVALTAEAVEALRTHRVRWLEERASKGELGTDGLVFVSVRGHPIHGENLLPEFYGHLERLGLPRVRLHDLRHSAATLLYEVGVPIPTIADMLGHASSRMLEQVYRHRVPALQQEAAAAMQRALRGTA